MAMGVASTKSIKQPTRARSAEQLETHVEYVNSVIEAICRSKSGDSFILLCAPLNDLEGARFEANIFVHKVKHQGKDWSETQKKLQQSQEKPFAKLGLDQFARFYDRVHLLAPLDGPLPSRSALTSSGTVKPGPESNEDSECMICMENAVEVVLPDCNHAFCKKCLEEWTAVSKTCPMCRSHTESNDTLWIMAENPTSDQLFSSLSELLTKLRAEATNPSHSGP